MYETFAGSLVSASQYMTEDQKRSSLEDNYLDDLEQALGKDTLAQLKKQGYDPKDFSTEAVTMNINQGTYEEQLMKLAPQQGQVPGTINTQPSPTATSADGQPLPSTRITNKAGNEVLAAGYVENNPELHMDIKKRDLYYYDKTSCSLVPLKDAEVVDGSAVLTRRQLDHLFKEYNLSPAEIENLYANLTNNDTINNMRPGSDTEGQSIFEDNQLPFKDMTTTTTPSKKTNSKPTGLSAGAIAGIVIGVLVLLVLIGVGIWWFSRPAKLSANTASNNSHF